MITYVLIEWIPSFQELTHRVLLHEIPDSNDWQHNQEQRNTRTLVQRENNHTLTHIHTPTHKKTLTTNTVLGVQRVWWFCVVWTTSYQKHRHLARIGGVRRPKARAFLALPFIMTMKVPPNAAIVLQCSRLICSRFI